MPEIVEVSEASFRLVCAVESDDSAEVTEAWSESIWLVDALGRLVARKRSSAEVSCACAALTSSESAVVSDGGKDLAGRDRLARLDVDGGHRARDGEVEVRPGWPARSCPSWPPSAGSSPSWPGR